MCLVLQETSISRIDQILTVPALAAVPILPLKKIEMGPGLEFPASPIE